MLVPRRLLIAPLFALPVALALPGTLLADTLTEIMPTANVRPSAPGTCCFSLENASNAESFPDARPERRTRPSVAPGVPS